MFDKTIGPFCMTGNSRAEPTSFLFRCDVHPGCPFSTVYKYSLATHISPKAQKKKEGDPSTHISPPPPASDPYALGHAEFSYTPTHPIGPVPTITCPRPGCDFILDPAIQRLERGGMMSTHVDQVHDGFLKPCVQADCDPEVLYSSRQDLFAHEAAVHLRCPPTAAHSPPPIPGVDEEERQLNSRHSEQRHFLPNQGCPLTPCSTTFVRRAAMIKHLQSSKHNLGLGEATILADRSKRLVDPSSPVLSAPQHPKLVFVRGQRCPLENCETTCKSNLELVQHLQCSKHGMARSEAEEFAHRNAKTASRAYKKRDGHVAQGQP